ncbi:hypothetical protein PV371_06695 [Streptomyces sp. TX20-6-3]|uniref:hypothetical protein n=1 Tax=Streptomyces sp. TX20-6-3 TaxID=3028705 RepID=UPI0029AA69B4|nr:hypothetical protein [Streptomyces sp. TX20-6-3]MDX2559335.1 hypothetical protein [Streptomyces sp. TX20-6-3]
MTDLSTEPIVTAPAPDQQADPMPAPAPVAPTPDVKSGVEHTAGGWPVVPLALTGTNATVTLLAGAALVGGPIAAAVAATGAVVLGATAARNHKTTAKQARQAKAGAGKTGTPSVTKSAGGARGSAGGPRGGSGRVPTQPKRGSAPGPKPGTRAGESAAPPGSKSPRIKPGAGSLRSASTAATGGRKPGMPQGTATARVVGQGSVGSSVSGKPRGRVGQVKALREQARTVSPSKAGRRAQTTAARRQIADARRAAKSDARTTATAKKGPVGRAVGKAAGRIGTARGAAVGKLRKARDTHAAGTVAEQRAEVRKAPARAKARKALWKSAARFQGRRLLAALLAGALGIVGMLTTPLGRKLGWAWLQHPGRRLYGRLMKQALAEREDRDEAIRDQRDTDEAAADAEAEQDGEQIGDTAERPAGLVPTTPTSGNSEGEIVSGFRFEEYAAEMEAAANSYDPENAMEILAMVEGLPAALTSVASVMRILAERADSEFPLEKEVADGFNDIYGALMSAVAVAEDMGPLFRQAHEQDIARHEDPRNGPEAEKGWNV